MKLLVLISFLAMPFMAMGSSLFFEGEDYSGQKLDGQNFAGADLYGADFRGASLRGANFEGADIRNADFQGADLRGANFNGARFYSGVDHANGGNEFFKFNLANFDNAIVDRDLFNYLKDYLHVELGRVPHPVIRED